MEAAQEGHVDIVKFLIERGSNVHAETSTQDTALTYAAANGHTLIADILLQCGAQLVRCHSLPTHIWCACVTGLGSFPFLFTLYTICWCAIHNVQYYLHVDTRYGMHAVCELIYIMFSIASKQISM